MKRTPLPEAKQDSPQASPPDWLKRAFTTAARHFQAGMNEEARQLLIGILEIEPRHADSMYLLGSVAFQSGDLGLAEDFLRQAIAIEANKSIYYVLFGNIFQRQGKLDLSEECYRAALLLEPNSADAYYNWGNTFEQQGRNREATACFEQALGIMPDHLQAKNNLANQYRQQGRLAESARLLESALRQDSNSLPILLNLGNVYMAQKRYTDSIKQIDHAISIAPGQAVLYSNKGNALKGANRVLESLDCYRQALELDSSRAEFWVNLGQALQMQGRMREALAVYGRAVQLAPDNAAAHGAGLFAMHYDPKLDPQLLLDVHKEWAAKHGGPLGRKGRPFANSPDPERRLRVGFVSPDFRQHPVAFFTSPLFAAHDRNNYEFRCYSSNATEDEWSRTLQQSVDSFQQVQGISDMELAEKVEADGIDVLVDLSGHTGGNRLLAFARKPAPVQISWLGYFNTTGLDTVDFLMVDDIIAPHAEQAPFTERPLRLNGCYLSYAGPDYAPEVSALPALDKGYVTFGCFNTLSKITEDVVRLWARVLHSSPQSKLMLKNSVLNDFLSRELYSEAFQREGIGPDRIVLVGSSPHAELLAAYSDVDIALDPFPYNGGTTTCEALWMGVPVITRSGDRFVSRVGSTILDNAGCKEWIAGSAEEYVEKAVQLASDLARLSEVRAGLRSRVKQSVLGDTVGFTRRFEDAVRMVWRDWCRKAG